MDQAVLSGEEQRSVVILSEVRTSQCEVLTESKDPEDAYAAMGVERRLDNELPKRTP